MNSEIKGKVFGPKPTRIMVSIIGSMICGVITIICLFLPMISISQMGFTMTMSLWDVTFGLESYISRMAGGQITGVSGAADALRNGPMGLLTFIMVGTAICALCITIFKIFDDQKVLRILALVAACVSNILVFILLVIIWLTVGTLSTAAYLASYGTAGVSMGFGLIIMYLLSIAAIVFTAIGIKYPMVRPRSVPVVPPMPMPMPAPAVPVSMPRPAYGAAQGVVTDDPATVAQTGAMKGVSGQYAGVRIDIRPNEKITVGRDPQNCNLIIKSDSRDISRVHCTVKYDQYENCYKVVDKSSNGTFANGQRLIKFSETQLSGGTELSLGNGGNKFVLI